jgi:hypothetical protein
MLIYNNYFALLLATLISVTIGQDLPSCASVNVAEETLEADCVTLCSPFSSTSNNKFAETDTSITLVLSCVCNDSETGCEDSVTLADKLAPLPSCDSLGIERTDQCGIFCDSMRKNIDTFRDSNGDNFCYCTEGWQACNDGPTCAQLQIFPGTVEADCQALCGADSTIITKDDVKLAGDLSKANKNQTHLELSCSCDGISMCDDFILFSDVSFMKECSDADIGVTTDVECEAFCVSNGFLNGHEFSSVNDLVGCSCSHNNGGSAVACQDKDSSIPSPTPGGTDNNPTSGDGGGGGGSSSGAVGYGGTSTALATAMISLAILWLWN